MMIAIGVAVVLLAIAFALWPLFRGSAARRADDPDPELLRAAMYRQLLDAELDTQLGKLNDSDYHELRERLLQDAAALIVASQDGAVMPDDAEARVEREIAAARAALRGQPSMPGASA